MSQDNKKSGFTLIELMLSMAFVSILLLAITMTVIEISNIYNRGLTLKEVNQAGRSLASDIQSMISASQPFDIDSQLITQDFGGGRLCLGQYSYIWNLGSAIIDNEPLRLNLYKEDTGETIRFVKVFDPSGSYCSDTAKKVDSKDAIELLNVGEHDLAIHEFKISSADSASDAKTNQRLYSISFVIGTNKKDTLVYEPQILCKAPNQAGADTAYCSVSQFDIVALAGNSVE